MGIINLIRLLFVFVLDFIYFNVLSLNIFFLISTNLSNPTHHLNTDTISTHLSPHPQPFFLFFFPTFDFYLLIFFSFNSSKIRMTEKFSITIHLYLNTIQENNDLKHFNYHKYNNYLTNKILKIRQKLPFPSISSISINSNNLNTSNTSTTLQTSTKSLKTKKNTGNQGNTQTKEFQMKKVSSEGVKDEKVLLLPLLLAERCYCKALISKNLYLKLLKSKLRHNILKFLSKSLKFLQEFEVLIEKYCTEQTILEMKAYKHYILGYYYLEKENWNECYKAYYIAMTIYKELIEHLNSFSYDLIGQKEVFKLYLTRIEPSLRFCCYNLQGNSSSLLNSTFNSSSTSISSTNSTTNESVINLFSNDLEMLEKLEIIRLKRVTTSHTNSIENNHSITQIDPIYEVFNKIIWCNRSVTFPSSSNSSSSSSSSSITTTNLTLSQSDLSLLNSLYSSCDKLISFLKLHFNNVTINSLALHSIPLPSGTFFLSLEFYSNYSNILNEILQIVLKIRKNFPPNILNSNLITNRLSNQSLEHFQNYIQYCILDTQQQQHLLLLFNSKQQHASLSSYTEKLLNSNEKVFICNQIDNNLNEMIQLVEGFFFFLSIFFTF